MQLLVAVGAKIILENNYTKATFVRDIALGGPPKVDVRKRGRGGGRAKTDICGQGGLGGSKNSNFLRTSFMESPLHGFDDVCFGSICFSNYKSCVFCRSFEKA